MVVIKIVDNNEIEYGIHVYENNENGEVFVQDDFHCHAEEDGFDTIFGTNDEQVLVQINPAKFIAQHITDHIMSCHPETYDKKRAYDCLYDYFSDHTSEIIEEIDKLMKEHLKKNNLTIKNE
ncbi:MAG: hypothetical protein IKF82_00365 [Bacilli bacterium]|nr:hypothetical protein [Bacilli bacterium]